MDGINENELKEVSGGLGLRLSAFTACVQKCLKENLSSGLALSAEECQQKCR